MPGRRTKQFTRTILLDSHVWLAGEPTSVGGGDLAIRTELKD
jgi:hypothetical protein